MIKEIIENIKDRLNPNIGWEWVNEWEAQHREEVEAAETTEMLREWACGL